MKKGLTLSAKLNLMIAAVILLLSAELMWFERDKKRDREPSTVSLESPMKSKNERTAGTSISVKLNILIIAVIIVVCALLFVISNSAYRRAVFRSQETKLDSIEFPYKEETVQILDHLQRIFETEEFQNTRAMFRPGSIGGDGSSAMADWMETQPGWLQLDFMENSEGSMLFDWLYVTECADIFWENNSLESVRIDVQKDGKAWHIYDRAVNEEDTIKFDYVGEAAAYYPESEAGSFRSAVLTQIGDSHLCLRCIRGKMEGGGEYCIWAAVDMTDEVKEYRKFQITSLLSVVVLTILINGFMMFVPGEILTAINAQICKDNISKMFVTVWIGILNVKTGVLTCSNAGHEYPFIRGADGEFRVLRDKHGLVVGGMKKTEYRNYELKLEPGSAVFVYTDGVTEANDQAAEMFGIDRLEASLNRSPKDSPREILDRVKADVDAFTDGANHFDDVTMLCLEYKGPAAPKPAKPA